jgi:hypothetical protein
MADADPNANANNQGQQGAVAPGQGAPGPAQVLPPTILLSPWDGDLDLSQKTGKALWDEGIKPLENKFSGNGRDLVRFLADVTNRTKKCKWQAQLTIAGKNLLTNYGEITIAEVEAARALRLAAPVTSLADARPKVNALMLYFFIYDSLGEVPQKKLSTKLSYIDQDGPLLLKVVLDQTFVATQASTFAIKEKFYALTLKQYKWNVQLLNQDVREKLVDLLAAGNASDETDILISLFRAYKTATNEEFLHAVDYWKNEWSAGSLITAEALMDKADKKYAELRDLGTWGKRSAKDDQIVALLSQVDALKKQGGGNAGKGEGKKPTAGNKKKGPQWKFDRSASSTNELTKNGKTYKWCTGPGHNKTPMWVVHEPGQCTGDKSGVKKDNKPNQAGKTMYNRQALTSILKKRGDLTEEEVESKVDAMIAVMSS